MALADFQDLVDDFVRDDENRITTDDRDAAIALAVARYSEDRPRKIVVDLTAAGGHYLDLPESWEDGFSQLETLEHPVDQVPPSEISPADWRLYHSPSGTRIMVAFSFAAAASVRATHTGRHVLDDEADTIPFGAREPVAAYGASILLDQLASATANSSDPTIGADSVDHRSKSQEYAARARAHRNRYLNTFGLTERKNVAHGVVVDLDLTDSRGRDRLTHPGRYR
ncbi:hypothetical protein [Thalassobaculum litoreum]|uniref:Uncharacterized protein n=1 Tax=Thalassobaculum litoreum DSM 18839 TaxID=1123362 RepID=A0A8G2BP97_9PROT|nr:hypothetical protein [Thalassobaculum litoreum]SDG60720.1 hypothetical protein SAMN05660686_05000 [Thalassobaculum litoreum DSM 18839]